MSERGEHLGSAGLTDGLRGAALWTADKLAVGRHFVTGSDSSAFTKVDAARQPQLDPGDYDWVDVAGDPDANSWRPRGWNTASVIGALQRSVYSHEGVDYSRTLDAVAWVEDDEIVVATGIGRPNLFGGKTIEGEAGLTVAKRRGPEDLKVTMGLWDSQAGKLLVPDEVVLLDAEIPTAGIAQEGNYPHTRLI